MSKLKTCHVTGNSEEPPDRKCKCGCGKSIAHKHPNALFLSQRHKDAYWNEVNPRSGWQRTSFFDDGDL